MNYPIGIGGDVTVGRSTVGPGTQSGPSLTTIWSLQDETLRYPHIHIPHTQTASNACWSAGGRQWCLIKNHPDRQTDTAWVSTPAGNV